MNDRERRRKDEYFRERKEGRREEGRDDSERKSKVSEGEGCRGDGECDLLVVVMVVGVVRGGGCKWWWWWWSESLWGK